MAEYWDIYDINRIKTGRTMMRGDAFKPGDYQVVVHACVFNRQGQMLIQQRQPFKQGWPNKWDITMGGSAVQGDTSQTAAERELMEELGLKVNLQGVRPYLTLNFSVGFDDFYLIEQEVNLADLNLQPEEVQAAKWATEEEILHMIETDDFIPYYPHLIKLFFAMKGKEGGAHMSDPMTGNIQ